MTPSWEIQAHGRKAAAGLVWVPLIATTRAQLRREFRQQMRALHSRYGALYAPRGARYPLAAIVRPREGNDRALRGRIPVALWLAASVAKPTVYIGPHEPGAVWILAAEPGVPDPRGDVVVPAREAPAIIQDLALDYLQASDEPQVVLAPGLHLEGVPPELPTRRMDLDAILRPDPPRVVVAKHLGVPTWAMAVAAVAVVTGGGIWLGPHLMAQWDGWQQRARHSAAPAASAPSVRAASNANRSLLESAQQEASATTATPWPHAFISACAQAFYQAPARLGGWHLHQVTCEAGGVARASYVIDSQARAFPIPTQQSLRRAAQALHLDVSVGWFATTAEARLPFRLPPPRKGLDLADLPDETEVGERLASIAQRIGALTGAQLQADQPAPRDTSTSAASPVATGVIRATGKGLWLLREAIPDEAYLTLRSLTIKPEQGQMAWSAEGAFVMRAK